MNFYTQKQVWKLVLFALAGIIVGISLWYTRVLVDKIAGEERKKALLWAEAIQKKANLVNYTNELFQKIGIEERKKVELWAEATKQLATANNITDYTFILKVVQDNTTVPVILTDERGVIISTRNLEAELVKDTTWVRQQIEEMKNAKPPIEVSFYGKKKNFLYYQDSRLFSELKQIMDDLIKSFISEIVVNSASAPVIFTDHTRANILAYGNIDSLKIQDSDYLLETIKEMEDQNIPIEIHLSDDTTNYLFYKDSFLLTQLRYFPLIQFLFIGLFILIAYWLFSISRRTEQNQVWVGMAKETAHQLGTPLSSLIAWLELFKSRGLDQEMINEIEKDVQRLETITDRFSKIGSAPKLTEESIEYVVEKSMSYLRTRSSDKVLFSANYSPPNLKVKLNVPLFEWVLENLCKNAVDAMEGVGSITISVFEVADTVVMDVTDTGKGISASKQKTVFEPGYTTKKRGWGLGLSLSKRIIEMYHAGKIFVKRSELGKGTTFRIVLKK